jgi:hypothetical protein
MEGVPPSQLRDRNEVSLVRFKQSVKKLRKHLTEAELKEFQERVHLMGNPDELEFDWAVKDMRLFAAADPQIALVVPGELQVVAADAPQEPQAAPAIQPIGLDNDDILQVILSLFSL